MARSDTLYQVAESFITSVRGIDVEYRAGEVVTGDDPAYRKHPQLFKPLVIRGQLPYAAPEPVEQATAAPGELRGQAITTARFKGR